MSNIDFEIGKDNPAAVAIRAPLRPARHPHAHGLPRRLRPCRALHDVANVAEDLHIYGGRYGILMRKPSAAWQFTLLDSTIEGQREAAIRENEAGLTVVHCTFRDVPTAIAIDERYSDQLWVKDTRFENISGPAVIISNETNRMTEVNLETVYCRKSPRLCALPRERPRAQRPGATPTK